MESAPDDTLSAPVLVLGTAVVQYQVRSTPVPFTYMFPRPVARHLFKRVNIQSSSYFAYDFTQICIYAYRV
jgi:hypothetical protein